MPARQAGNRFLVSLKGLQIQAQLSTRRGAQVADEKLIPPFKVDILWAMDHCFPGVINSLINSKIQIYNSSLGRYVFGSEISYNKAPPRLPGLAC